MRLVSSPTSSSKAKRYGYNLPFFFSLGVLVGLSKDNLKVAFNRELTAAAFQDLTEPTPLAFSGVAPKQESTHATVMGMATGYDVKAYQRFVGSLRRTGFKGNIILAVSPVPLPGVEQYLLSQNVTMKRLSIVNCSQEVGVFQKMDSHAVEALTCADPYPDLKVRWGRFALLRDYLDECKSCTGPVLVADVRDTFFQRDPFGQEAPPIPPGQLQVFEEHRTMRTTHWLVKNPVEKCKRTDDPNFRIFDRPMLCSGTTIGTRDAMLRYLRDMVTEMRLWMKKKACCCNKMNGDDQSIHNYLYYTKKLPYAVPQKNRVGLVHTVGSQGAMLFNEKRKRNMEEVGMAQGPASTKSYTSDGDEKNGKWLGLQHDLTDAQGYFIDFNGERSFVVHQYDRFGLPFDRWFDNKSGLWRDPVA